MAAVHGRSRRARWQVATTVWPRPRTVRDGDHNAEWVLLRCSECGEWEACLNTVARVDVGDELTVGSDERILGGPSAEWPIEMTFRWRRRGD